MKFPDVFPPEKQKNTHTPIFYDLTMDVRVRHGTLDYPVAVRSG